MAPGTRSKLGALMFETGLFGSKCTVLKKVFVKFWDFSAPIVIRRPGNGDPFAPLVTPLDSSLYSTFFGRQ